MDVKIFKIMEEGKLKELKNITDSDTRNYVDREGFIVALKANLPYSSYGYYKIVDENIVSDEDANLEHIKQVKINKIKRQFQRVIDAGYECSNGIIMDADFADILKLKSGYELASNTMDDEMIIVDYFNNKYVVNTEDVGTMIQELSNNYLELWKRKNDLIDNIEAGNSVEAVSMIKF